MKKVSNTLGKRIDLCRNLSKLTRPAFERKYNFSKSTLYHYELDLKKPSDKKLQELFTIFNNENVSVTLQWLKNGEGEPPKEFKKNEIVKVQNVSHINQINIVDGIQLIENQKLLLKKLYPNIIIGKCNSYDLEPLLTFGDYVAGIPIKNELISELIDVLCLFQIGNATHIKIINHINSNSTLNLAGINQKKADKNYFLFNVSPEIVAPVIWTHKNPDDFI